MIKEMAILLLEGKDVYLTDEGKRLLEVLVSRNTTPSQGGEKWPGTQSACFKNESLVPRMICDCFFVSNIFISS